MTAVGSAGGVRVHSASIANRAARVVTSIVTPTLEPLILEACSETACDVCGWRCHAGVENVRAATQPQVGFRM